MRTKKSANFSTFKGATALLAAVLVASPYTTHALGDHEPLTTVRQVAADFALEHASRIHGSNVTATAANLDPRLRLARCRKGLQAFHPHSAKSNGSTLVGVRCLGPVRWNIYVSVDVSVEAEVLVAHRGIGRGREIGAEDVRIEPRRLRTLGRGYFTSLEQLDGLVTRRSLSAGKVISPNQLKSPRLVRRGDRVTLLINTGAIRITAAGESKSDGARGDIVQAVNANSGKRVRGRVVGKGRVEVML